MKFNEERFKELVAQGETLQQIAVMMGVRYLNLCGHVKLIYGDFSEARKIFLWPKIDPSWIKSRAGIKRICATGLTSYELEHITGIPSSSLRKLIRAGGGELRRSSPAHYKKAA